MIYSLDNWLRLQAISCYVINVDLAALFLPYNANLDIRDTFNCRNVMRFYSLGPNGAILTALNLFASKFGEVLSICRAVNSIGGILFLVDTSGQIFLFTTNTTCCLRPQIFVSNMLQVCSTMYRSRLPAILTINKCDLIGSDFLVDWIENFEKLCISLRRD